MKGREDEEKKGKRQEDERIHGKRKYVNVGGKAWLDR